MPPKKKRIFISHPWGSNNPHDKIVNLIQKDSNKSFYNHSVKQNEPLSGNKTEVKRKIEQKIKGSSVVIVNASNHASHRKMIKEEIRIAKKYGKKVVAVRPRGQKNISKIVRDNADHIVGWNNKSISNAIRAKGNDNQRRK
jgi:hypothetical protein